jgi:hypothetical protein
MVSIWSRARRPHRAMMVYIIGRNQLLEMLQAERTLTSFAWPTIR